MRAAFAAARLRYAQDRGSVHRYAVSPGNAGYLHEERAGGIIEIRGKGAVVRKAALTDSDLLSEVDGSQKVSVRVVIPHAVNELVGAGRGLVLPHSQTDIAPSRIDIRVMDLGPTGIPELVRFLDGCAADHELDVPKANDGRTAGAGCGGRRFLLRRAGLTNGGCCRCGHRGEGIAA